MVEVVADSTTRARPSRLMNVTTSTPDPTPTRGSAGSRLVTRLREIAALDDGWLDGEGLKARSAVLTQAIGTIGQLSDDPALAGEVDHVRAFPTMEGGVQFEFSSGDLEGSVELRPDLTAHFSESDLVSSEDDESTFQAGELLDALRRLLGVPA